MILNSMNMVKNNFFFRCSVVAVLFQSPPGFASAPGETEYFQQYAHYSIDARLDINLNHIHVNETLLYTNHSTDTLQVMYFHLYMNKYRAGSLYLPDLKTDLGGITIHTVQENDSLQKKFSIV